jgi:predicted transposase YdaD
LLSRAKQEIATAIDRQGIIEIISRIMACKFTNLSSQEIDEMVEIRVEETRVYQEAQEKERRSMALKMLAEHMPLEQIARITGLPIAQIQDLRSQG